MSRYVVLRKLSTCCSFTIKDNVSKDLDMLFWFSSEVTLVVLQYNLGSKLEKFKNIEDQRKSKYSFRKWMYYMQKCLANRSGCFLHPINFWLLSSHSVGNEFPQILCGRNGCFKFGKGLESKNDYSFILCTIHLSYKITLLRIRKLAEIKEEFVHKTRFMLRQDLGVSVFEL